jgi:TP901 family phage tail tape measure protein
MSDQINYIINVSGNATAYFPAIEKAGKAAVDTVGNLRSGITKLGDTMFTLNNISNAFDRVNAAIDSASQPGIALNSSLTDLNAITGVTKNQLSEIEKYARKSAVAFGSSAAQGVESYKLVLSQLSPEIAKVPSALDSMGKHVAVLSKSMSGDTVAATEVLTTAMNQYQVSLDDPTEASRIMAEMMNIMAAAAKEGSAELPAIKAAVENSGMAAKSAGVKFNELNAAIQVLDKSGKKGAEGGIAIRNSLSILSEGRFMPKTTLDALTKAGIDIEGLSDKSKTFADRLRLLKPVLNDTALMSQIFGRENSNAGIALISQVDLIDEYKQKITGTNSATEQATIVMSKYTERMSRLNARFDNLKISVFNFAHGVLPYFKTSVLAVQGLTSTLTLVNMIAVASESAFFISLKQRAKAMWQTIPATWAMISSQGTWLGVSLMAAVATKALTASVKSLGIAIYSIPIVGWIALGITLLAGLFKMLWDKSEKFRQILFSVWEVTKAVFTNIGVVIKGLWEKIVKPYFTLIYNFWKTIITGIINAGAWLWNGLVSVFQGIGNFFVKIWTNILGLFSNISGWLGRNLLSPVKDVFSKLWSFISGILDKIINALMKPIKWIKELWNKAFPKDQFLDLGEAAAKGVKKGTESWNKSKIKPAVVPGLGGSIDFNKSGSSIDNSTAGGKVQGIASGGSRNTEIHINMKNMVESISFEGNLKENTTDLKRKIEEVLLQTLNMAYATSS